MRILASRSVLLLGLLLLLAILGAAPTARPVRAEETARPAFAAWDLHADFSGSAPVVIVTAYQGLHNPPEVTQWTQFDISANCVQQGPGSITYQNGYAQFDGNAYLACQLPPVLMGGLDCEVNASKYFFFGADATLRPVMRGNPIVAASDGSFFFGLPSNGVEARTRGVLSGTEYQTAPWQRDNAGNELLLGQDGPLMIEAANTIGLLDFLNPSWQITFEDVDETKVGHWMYSSGGVSTWGTSAALLPYRTPPPYVYIGYNPATGAIFDGRLTTVEVDPPGCTVK
jgi:hypothetical protein